MNVDKIQAGREMDALIAEKITGFKPVTMTAGIPPHFIYPQYSTDIAAAWQVIERLKKLKPIISYDPYSEKWYVRFNGGESCSADTVMLAICRAALKAVGFK